MGSASWRHLVCSTAQFTLIPPDHIFTVFVKKYAKYLEEKVSVLRLLGFQFENQKDVCNGIKPPRAFKVVPKLQSQLNALLNCKVGAFSKPFWPARCALNMLASIVWFPERTSCCWRTACRYTLPWTAVLPVFLVWNVPSYFWLTQISFGRWARRRPNVRWISTISSSRKPTLLSGCMTSENV